jgi:hypothetical protein
LQDFYRVSPERETGTPKDDCHVRAQGLWKLALAVMNAKRPFPRFSLPALADFTAAGCYLGFPFPNALHVIVTESSAPELRTVSHRAKSVLIQEEDQGSQQSTSFRAEAFRS